MLQIINYAFFKKNITVVCLCVLPCAVASCGKRSLFSDRELMPEAQVVETPEEQEVQEEGRNPSGEWDSDYLPYGAYGSEGAYVRDRTDDVWHPQAEIYAHAFHWLTPHGQRIFKKTISFVKDQKDPAFQGFAQPLRCVVNVTHVLNALGYKFDDDGRFSVPHFLTQLKAMGGVVYDLPHYDSRRDNRYEIVNYINEHFDGQIPTGMIVAGCSNHNCYDSSAYGAHVGIVGDKNQYGEIMVYHNNWLRPNNLKGQRRPYMVSLENFYMMKRPREWMATPWIYVLNDEEDGKMRDFVSVLPLVDDLDPLSEKYHIKLGFLPQLHEEFQRKLRVHHHKNLVMGNPHINIRIKEKRWEVCKSKGSLRDVKASLRPEEGHVNGWVIQELVQFDQGTTFLDHAFEFAPVDRKDGWVSALVYDAGRYWGAGDKWGDLWIKEKHMECGPKGTAY